MHGILCVCALHCPCPLLPRSPLCPQLFEEFEPQPIAAASLGQVHVAKVRGRLDACRGTVHNSGCWLVCCMPQRCRPVGSLCLPWNRV